MSFSCAHHCLKNICLLLHVIKTNHQLSQLEKTFATEHYQFAARYIKKNYSAVIISWVNLFFHHALCLLFFHSKKKLKEVCFFTFLRDISKKSLILIVIEFSFFHTQGLSWDWYYGVCLNFRAYFFLSKPTKQYNNKFSNLRESSWF